MKLIIAGSRTIPLETAYLLIEALFVGPGIIRTGGDLHIISGCAKGVDEAGIEFAKDNNLLYSEYPANWAEHGKSAGPRRNKEMADVADALLLIWDGESKGSLNMRTQMMKQDKPIYEIIITKENVF